MHLDHAHLLALLVQVVHRLLHRRARAHHDDHALGVGSSSVVEQVVLTTRDGGHLVHGRLDLVGAGVVERLSDHAVLHVDILGLSDTTLVGVVRIQGSLAEDVRVLVGVDLRHLLAGDLADGVHLVGHSPAVEEVKERNAARDGGQVSHQSQIVRLLHAVRGQDGKTSLTSRHHIRVLAKKRQGLLRHHTRRHVNDGGQKTTGNTVHVGNHQHHTLRRGEGRSQQTTHQSTVKGTSSASLRLHLRHTKRVTEDVLSSLDRPCISVLSHSGRGTDRIQDGSVAHIVSRVGSSLITIDDSTDGLVLAEETSRSTFRQSHVQRTRGHDRRFKRLLKSVSEHLSPREQRFFNGYGNKSRFHLFHLSSRRFIRIHLPSSLSPRRMSPQRRSNSSSPTLCSANLSFVAVFPMHSRFRLKLQHWRGDR